MTSTLEAPQRTTTAIPTVLDARVVTGSGGGPDKTILNQPRHLKLLGYRNLCVYLSPPNDAGYAEIEAKAKKYSAPLVTVPDRGPWDLRILRKLLRICREENVAIWHGHDYKTNALGLVLRRFHRMHLVTTVHGWVQHTNRTPLYYRIDKRCLPRYEKVICVSDDLFAECEALGVKAGNLVLVENAIDAEEYRRRQCVAAAKAKLGLDANVTLLGAVGRLSEEKGFDVLIDAVAPLMAKDRSLFLMIVGEGGGREKLESQIARHNLANRISLPGWRSDVRDIFEALDLFVLSSRREGLPNVLLEAMALEVPVVATSVNGVPKLVRDGVDGTLVPAENVPALTGAIDAALKNPRRHVAAARQRIEERFSFPVRMAKIASIYDGLLGGRHA